MSTSLLDPSKTAGFSDEQKHYLEGFFAGIKVRGVSFADTTPATPAPEPELIKEERIKRELHPLDAIQQLVEDARYNQPPEAENIFRYKWNGLFFLTPVKDAYMARLRIPGGQLKSFQLREIAKTASDLTSGYIQITTRANFQIRVIEPKNTPEFLRRIQSVGLHTRGSGADNIRNLTANPTAGVDPHELIDVSPFVHELGQIILSSREFYNLPRKFNVAFDGGGLIGSLEDTNDIGVTAVKIKDSPLAPAGVYFRIAIGGATGHQAFARDMGVLLRPEELVRVLVAMIRVYLQHGNRSDRKKARLKHLLDTWAVERYREETEKLLSYSLLHDPLNANGNSALEERRTLPTIPHSHVGVLPQKQPELHSIGVAIPVGQVTSKQLLRIAELADLYGSGDIRLTVWQNLILTNIPTAYVETVKKSLLRIGLDWQQSHLRSGVVACTGNSYCKYASTNTKGHAIALMEYLDKKVSLDQPINIHLTGCPHSCAQHYIGDIGLLATKIKIGSDSVEAYHIFVGGGFGKHKAVGRQIFTGIRHEAVKSTIEKMLLSFLKHRQPGETFQAFTTRHDLNHLQMLFSGD